MFGSNTQKYGSFGASLALGPFADVYLFCRYSFKIPPHATIMVGTLQRAAVLKPTLSGGGGSAIGFSAVWSFT